jgi:hypothetical protein
LGIQGPQESDQGFHVHGPDLHSQVGYCLIIKVEPVTDLYIVVCSIWMIHHLTGIRDLLRQDIIPGSNITGFMIVSYPDLDIISPIFGLMIVLFSYGWF